MCVSFLFPSSPLSVTLRYSGLMSTDVIPVQALGCCGLVFEGGHDDLARSLAQVYGLPGIPPCASTKWADRAQVAADFTGFGKAVAVETLLPAWLADVYPGDFGKLARLFARNVPARYPRIKFVVPHAGALHDEVRVRRPPDLPREAVRRRRVLGTQPQAELEAALVRPVVVRVAAVHPPDRRDPERKLGHARQRADVEPLEGIGHGRRGERRRAGTERRRVIAIIPGTGPFVTKNETFVWHGF